MSNNSCLNTCASGFYGDNVDNSCKVCNSSCLTCLTSSSNSCQSCVAGKYLTATNECMTCSSTCKTCAISANNCLTCDDFTFLENNTCVANCLDGSFG